MASKTTKARKTKKEAVSKGAVFKETGEVVLVLVGQPSELKKKLKKIITNYVRTNFGDSEADDPSWAIKPLADDIVDTVLNNP